MATRTELRRIRRSSRQPNHFRAAVEVLDARRLLAAGITGTVIPLSGNAGSPLRVTEGALTLGGGIGGFTAPDFPVGQPVPLVLLTSSDTTSTLTATGLSGTVNWGDGTTTDAAQFGVDTSYTFTGISPNQLYVNGPEHTYAAPGNYTVTITLNTPGSTAPTTFTATATISATPILTEALDPASDTGFFNNDYVTADNTPTYTGTTGAGATVVLSATSQTTGQTLVVGTTLADASGNWSVTTVPFVDGSYQIKTTATNAFGGSASFPVFNPFAGGYGITIDAGGPTVSGFQVTNLKTGTFQVYYTDPAGLLIGPTVDTNLIAVSRTTTSGGAAQALRVTSLTQNATNPGGVVPTSTFIPVVGTFTTGKPILKNGTYTFTIYSAGVVGLSGATLDGEFNGRFPSGDGAAGGNFQVKINVRNGKVSGPLPVTSAMVAARAIPARAVGKHHAGAVRS